MNERDSQRYVSVVCWFVWALVHFSCEVAGPVKENTVWRCSPATVFLVTFVCAFFLHFPISPRKKTVVAHSICLFGQTRPRMHVKYIWPAFEMCMRMFWFRSPYGSVHTHQFKTEISKINNYCEWQKRHSLLFIREERKAEAEQLRDSEEL